MAEAERSDDARVLVAETAETRSEGTPAGPALESLARELAALRAAFDEKIRYDASREAIIDRLHRELEAHKANLVLGILRPLAQGLIQLQDDLARAAEAAPSEAAEDAQRWRRLASDWRADVLDLLDRQGFTAFQTEGPQFDPRRQQAARRVPTADAAQDRQVAERLRQGFAYDGTVVRPELVTVYVRQAGGPAAASHAPEPTE